MTFAEKQEALALMEPEMLFADGFEEALVGSVQIFNKAIAIYDRAKCIQILRQRDGMDEDEAEEFFDFNVTGAYMGEHTPAFATFFPVDSKKRTSRKRRK